MQVEIIRAKIDQAARASWWERRRTALVEGFVVVVEGLDRHRAEEGLLFIEEYVRSVPDLVESLEEAAQQAGLEEDLHPLLDAAVGYWELEEDHLPDRFGLVGLADDAYFSLRLIERFVEEYRVLADQDLLPSDLSQANRSMARLLGPDLVERLDEAVSETFERAQLRSSLVRLVRWRGRLTIKSALPVERDLPETPLVPKAEQVPVPEAGEEEGDAPAGRKFTTRELVQGNVSLLALGAGVGLFLLWQIYFRFPASAEIRLFGFDGIKLSWLVGLQNVILGSLGLSTILAASNLKNLIARFYRPFGQLQGDELKGFYAARGTVVFSLLVLALYVTVCFTNVTVRMGVDPKGLDVVAIVDGGTDAFFVTYLEGSEPETARISSEVRLGGPEETRLVLRGADARALILVRDKFNLTTLDAIRVRRRPWEVGYLKGHLVVPVPETLSPAERKLLRSSPTGPEVARSYGATRWTLDIRAPFRFARMVPNRITGESGTLYGPRGEHHLYIAPSDTSPCPDQAPLRSSEIQLFWEEICTQKSELAAWAGRSSFFDIPKVGAVGVDLPTHRVEVEFVRAKVYHSDREPPIRTREAARLVGIHRKWLEKDLETAQPGG